MMPLPKSDFEVGEFIRYVLPGYYFLALLTVLIVSTSYNSLVVFTNVFPVFAIVFIFGGMVVGYILEFEQPYKVFPSHYKEAKEFFGEELRIKNSQVGRSEFFVYNMVKLAMIKFSPEYWDEVNTGLSRAIFSYSIALISAVLVPLTVLFVLVNLLRLGPMSNTFALLLILAGLLAAWQSSRKAAHNTLKRSYNRFVFYLHAMQDNAACKALGIPPTFLNDVLTGIPTYEGDPHPVSINDWNNGIAKWLYKILSGEPTA